MADRIAAALDHVAVAVPDVAAAERRWVERLGGGQVSRGRNKAFQSQQYRFANGARLELLARPAGPSPADRQDRGFVDRFLDRFGATIHHVTFKVPDLHQALDVIRAAGLDVVDVNDRYEQWQEGFLRPSQVGGLVVQIAASPLSEAEWADMTGFEPGEPAPHAASLLGPRLRHPDLGRAERLWTLLGAVTSRDDQQLSCTWPNSPLSIVVEHGEPAGPVSLRMDHTEPLAAEPGIGPAVETAVPAHAQ